MTKHRKYSFYLLLCLCLFSSCHQDMTETRVKSLLSRMTLDEKIGQLVLYTSDWAVTGPSINEGYLEDIRAGRCSNIFNAYTCDYTRELQRIAVEGTRLGIPLLFGYDVIHGFRTITPIPLGESCSWDLDLISEDAAMAAAEASASGLHWTFAPMCDISRDPRWGRIMEGSGEDTYLSSEIAAARVRGFQGDSLSSCSTVAACVKHYAAYGAPEGGRDYNTVDMSERRFRDTYLPPYNAAVAAGAATVMTSFNEYDGIPATANKFLLKDILREELGFDGLVVTDYTSINEMVNHGYARDGEHAAELAFNASVDMDMQGGLYHSYLKGLVEQGKLSESAIDKAAGRVLRLKYDLGLFDDPYRYCDKSREDSLLYCAANMELAYRSAVESMVLLKNNDGVLPLSKGEKILVVGSLAESQADLLGAWHGAGEASRTESFLSSLREFVGKDLTYVKGCSPLSEDRSGFAAAISAARRADKIVAVLGESCNWSGEAASRTSISLTDTQTALLEGLAGTGKPVVLVLMNGRPLELTRESALCDAVLETWFAGTRGADAITDVLYGVQNPSGKLTVSFPRSVGQIPLSYSSKNTGRPACLPDPKYKSIYLDCPNEPLYPFGFGLSYTQFAYSDPVLSSDTMDLDGKIDVTVTVSNVGELRGCEVVQLYIRDMVGSVTRPLKELKGFRRISLEPGESEDVVFTITPSDLSFHRDDMSYGPEAGDFSGFVGSSSEDCTRMFNFTLE